MVRFRAGRPLGTVGPIPFAAFVGVELSPDGTRLAMFGPGVGSNADIWLFDLARRQPTQLTFSAGGRPSSHLVTRWSTAGFRVQTPGSNGLLPEGCRGRTAGGVAASFTKCPEARLAIGLVIQRYRLCQRELTGRVTTSGCFRSMAIASRIRSSATRGRRTKRGCHPTPDGSHTRTSRKAGQRCWCKALWDRSEIWHLDRWWQVAAMAHRWKGVLYLAADGKLMAVPIHADDATFRTGRGESIVSNRTQRSGRRTSGGLQCIA